MRISTSWKILLGTLILTFIVSGCAAAPVAQEAMPTATSEPAATVVLATTVAPTATPVPTKAPDSDGGKDTVPPLIASKELYLGLEGEPYDDGVTEIQYPGPTGNRWFPALGAVDAPVTVMEFSEVFCGHCQTFNQTNLEGILEDYVATGKVRYVGHMMAFNRPESQEYLAAAMCAAEQGRYFAYEHAVFAQITQNEFDLDAAAKTAEIEDYDRFVACREAGRYNDAAADASLAAVDKGLRVTPTFLVNGQKVEGNDPATIRRLIEEALSGGESAETTEQGAITMPKNPADRDGIYTAPPAMVIDPAKQYTATIVTEKGDIVAELYADKVPNTVNNFVFLARDGFYDNTTFHRVIPDFMAQAGDPAGTGRGGPGYRFVDEFSSDLRHVGPGILSMANAGPGTNGSQFFITFVDTPWLDGRHAVFGKVIEGLDVLLSISVRDPQTATKPGDLIETITIEEK